MLRAWFEVWKLTSIRLQINRDQTKTSHSDETETRTLTELILARTIGNANYKIHKSINQKTNSSYILTRSDKIRKFNSSNSLCKWKWTQNSAPKFIKRQQNTKSNQIKTINTRNLQLDGKSNSNHIVKINLRIHKKTSQNQPNDAV